MSSSSNVIRAAAAAQAIAVAAGCAYAMRRRADLPMSSSSGQEPLNAAHVLRACDSIIKACHGYGFVCTPGATSSAAPDCRVMDLHRLGGSSTSLDFALVSRTHTRKAGALQGEQPQCSIAFQDPRCSGENGYCVLSGGVREVPPIAMDEREALWKPSWSFFHPGPHSREVALWAFRPQRVECISHADSVTQWWAPVTLLRAAAGSEPGSSSAADAPWVLQGPKARPIRDG